MHTEAEAGWVEEVVPLNSCKDRDRTTPACFLQVLRDLGGPGCGEQLCAWRSQRTAQLTTGVAVGEAARVGARTDTPVAGGTFGLGNTADKTGFELQSNGVEALQHCNLCEDTDR